MLSGGHLGHKNMAVEVTCAQCQAPACCTALPGHANKSKLAWQQGCKHCCRCNVVKLSGGDVAAAHAAVTPYLVVTQLLLPAVLRHI